MGLIKGFLLSIDVSSDALILSKTPTDKMSCF